MKYEEWKKNFEEYPIKNGYDEAITRFAWNACKAEILKILQKPLKNLDLSEDYCDERHIEKIKNL